MEEDDFNVDLKPNIMKVEGFTKISGGDFQNDIHVDGFANITENLTCDYMEVNGFLWCKKDLLIRGDLSCNGLTRIKGGLHIDQDLELNGKSKIFHDLYCGGNATVDGKFTGKGKITVHRDFTINGHIACKNNLKSNGKITIHGKLKALMNIEGKNLTIRSDEKSSNVKLPQMGNFSKIRGNVTISNDVSIEDTHVVGMISGNNVEIGKNRVVLSPVRYVNEISVHPTAILEQGTIQIRTDQI